MLIKLIVGIRSVNSSNHHGHATREAHGHALGCAHTTGGDTTVRYGLAVRAYGNRAKSSPNTRYGKLPQPSDMVVGEYTMLTSRGKKTAVPTSKKRKGATSSSGPTIEIRHPFLQFPLGPQEELFQILWVRPLGVGHYIDWAALEQVQLADAVRALLTTDPNGLVPPRWFGCRLSVPEFRIALGLALVPDSATYDPSRSKVLALAPSLRYLHAILAHTLTGQWESTDISGIRDESSPLAPMSLDWHGTSGSSTQQHNHPPSLSSYHLVQSTKEKNPENITDDVPPRHEDPPSQPPPIHRPIFQHLHISSPPSPREPSGDDDV
ncbi:hypothetical protein GOBAR_AA33735 [Gossypium barbadense]|uniref:Uncharacterized protein n=1 Tax=Gossypium barbadense TaxID=3634 RepID=A0A2P5W788_GOSBA|nr:hypothetical protein GOBAR_AA33735 [Gossypium barbadense]